MGFVVVKLGAMVEKKCASSNFVGYKNYVDLDSKWFLIHSLVTDFGRSMLIPR